MSKATRVIGTGLLMACATTALALGVRVEDCTSPKSGLELLDRYPELAEACEAVVQVDGRRYLQMGARLRQVRDEALVLRLNGSTYDMALSPGGAEPVAAAAETPSPAIPVGSPLSVYVPEDRVLEVFADAATLAEVEVPVVVESAESRDARIANYTCCPRRRPWYPVVEFLPMTAGPLPFMGLVGVGLLAAAAALRQHRLRRR